MRPEQVKAAVGADPTGLLVRPEGDFFATSAGAVQSLLKVERFPGRVWEAACGNGAISRVLETEPEITLVISSDLYNRGYGSVGHDFLHDPPMLEFDHVITNPPFNAAEAFAQRALAITSGKVALFARLAWLEGGRRYRSLWQPHPPARVWVFSSRVPLARNGGAEQTGLICFAWFVWSKDHVGPPQLGWL